jgi:serine/threonine protein kinase
MSCLARHKNILNIFGYGWNIERVGVIPFLVTEFAAEGTLRAYLKSSSSTVHEKLLFCKDVAQGLHFLHVSGIAHGDLKLDNVLVTPSISSGAAPLEGTSNASTARSSGVEACISDFGHSLHLYDDEGDKNVKQRYGGTLAYNAPELLGERHARNNLNFRKCDVWSLGLLCWEVLLDGHAYYHSSDVQNTILSSQQRSTISQPTSSSINPSMASSTASLLEELGIIAPQLATIACHEVALKVQGALTDRETDRLRFLFDRCLETDPEKRLADLPLLPLLNKRDAALVPLSSRVQDFAGTSWSFEIFQIGHLIPYQVREQIVNDCRKIANEPGDSIVSARAAFQLAFAYASGFGVVKNSDEAVRWFEKSSAKGFRIAEAYLPALRSITRVTGNDKVNEKTTYVHVATAYELVKKRFLESTRRAVMESLTTSLLEVSPENEENAPSDSPTDVFSVDYLSKKSELDEQDINGNSSLLLACKFGKTATVKWLIDEGANRSLTDQHGSSAMHWLFMFPDDDIDKIAAWLADSAHSIVLPRGVTEPVFITSISSVNKISLSPRPFQIDPQLPFQFAATPLSFAVAAYCRPAVDTLLLLNGDPLVGIYPWRQNVRNYSAIHVATRLHMADLLGMFLNHLIVRKNVLPHSDIFFLLNGLRECIASTTTIERTIIHGPYTRRAAEQTVRTLQEYYDYIDQRLRVWELLRPAIRQADLEICSAILAVEKSAGVDPQDMLNEGELKELMLACTLTACVIGPDTGMMLRLMEFATSLGAKVDFSGDVLENIKQQPIFIVIEHHHAGLLDWMIRKQKVNLKVQDQNGDTPLHAIIASGFSATYSIEKLLQHGADPRVKNGLEQLPIQLALDDRTVDEFRALLPFTEESEIQELFDRAVISNFTKIVLTIMAYIRDTGKGPALDLDTALYNATYYASGSRTIQTLVTAGANPLAMSSFGTAPLHYAASVGNVEALQALIKCGADVNQSCSSAQAMAPILYAVHVITRPVAGGVDSAGARVCCEVLLKQGATLDCQNREGKNPLQELLSVRFSLPDLELVDLFLKSGATLPNSLPIMVSALQHSDYDLVDLLLTHKVKLEGVYNGMPLLHHCAALKMLNATSVKKFASSKLFSFAQQLIQTGADLFQRDIWGRTALDIAVQNDNGLITLLLIEHHKETGKIHQGDLLVPVEASTEPTRPPQDTNRSTLSSLFHKSSKQEPSPVQINHAPPFTARNREAQALITAWKQAIHFKSLSSICVFFSTDSNGPPTMMNRSLTLSLLCYALEHEISETITRFLGSVTDDLSLSADPYLKTIWQSADPYLRLTRSGPTRKPKIFSRHRKPANSMAEDPDLPNEFESYVPRLQYLNALGGYTTLLPVEWLVRKGFYEAHTSSCFKECVVDVNPTTPGEAISQVPSILLFDDFDPTTAAVGNTQAPSLDSTPLYQNLKTLGVFGDRYHNGQQSTRVHDWRNRDEVYPDDTFKEVVSVTVLETDTDLVAEINVLQHSLDKLGGFGETWRNGASFKNGIRFEHQYNSYFAQR